MSRHDKRAANFGASWETGRLMVQLKSFKKITRILSRAFLKMKKAFELTTKRLYRLTHAH